jgi:hypothetical protein
LTTFSYREARGTHAYVYPPSHKKNKKNFIKKIKKIFTKKIKNLEKIKNFHITRTKKFEPEGP